MISTGHAVGRDDGHDAARARGTNKDRAAGEAKDRDTFPFLREWQQPTVTATVLVSKEDEATKEERERTS